MIVSMHSNATESETQRVCERIQERGLKCHTIPGEERLVIAVVGTADAGLNVDAIAAMPGVDRVVRISAPYKYVSKEFKKNRTVVRLKGAQIGGDHFTVIAGPCSVESEEQIIETAKGVAACGATLLRGGAFKPRSSPYEFQGLGLRGVQLLAKARSDTGLGIVTEVLSERDVEVVAEYVDMIQVGARNMQNFALLKALGRCGRPVLLKRGLSATIKELLMSAEYIVAHGNPNVVLCERGIRTFETATRNTCDISAIPVLNELTHLPVLLDPSHAAGKRSLVPALARAAVAVGADGIIVEVHPNPEQALSDGAQSITVAGFKTMMRELDGYLTLWNESRMPPVAAVA